MDKKDWYEICVKPHLTPELQYEGFLAMLVDALEKEESMKATLLRLILPDRNTIGEKMEDCFDMLSPGDQILASLTYAGQNTKTTVEYT